jgi:hypothetical protein
VNVVWHNNERVEFDVGEAKRQRKPGFLNDGTLLTKFNFTVHNRGKRADSSLRADRHKVSAIPRVVEAFQADRTPVVDIGIVFQRHKGILTVGRLWAQFIAPTDYGDAPIYS